MCQRLVCIVLIIATLAVGCSEKPAASLSCSMIFNGNHPMDAHITISANGQTATLVWVTKTQDLSTWIIRGQLDGRFFKGTVDGDLGTHISIDRTTGELEMADSKEPIRRYVGKCESSNKDF